MTTRRYTEAQLAERLVTPGWRGYVLRSADRFGDNGIVGVALTSSDGRVREIDTLLLSCRVIGRRIETALVAHLADSARAAGETELRGWFKPTAKNAPARQIYEQAGLSRVRDEDGAELWSLDLHQGGVKTPAWISVASDHTAPGA